MVDFSNLIVALAAVVGVVLLVAGRVPIPGRNTVRSVFVRLAGAVLLFPWPAARGLALLAKTAREMDGNPPDKPETVQLITAFVQLVLLFWAGVVSLALILMTSAAGKPLRRDQSDAPK